jgi:hypothetical protein
VFDEMSARKYFPRIERNFLGLDGMVPITSGLFNWAKLICAKILKKGLLMSYGKILKLGF